MCSRRVYGTVSKHGQPKRTRRRNRFLRRVLFVIVGSGSPRTRYLNLQVNTQKYSQRATRISFAAFDRRLRSALSVG
jgi:hypothetical protein